MAEEKKDNKPKPKKKRTKVSPTTIIFFIAMVIGLIVFTVLALKSPSTTTYEKIYGEDASVTIDLHSNNKIDINLNIANEKINMSGTYKQIKDSENYEVTIIEDDEESVFKMTIKDKELTLELDKDNVIVCEEKT